MRCLDGKTRTGNIQETICVDQLQNYYFGQLMKAGSYHETLEPEEFATAYTAKKLADISSAIENLIWDSTNAVCEGLIYTLNTTPVKPQLINGTGTWSGVTMSVTNACDIVDSMINTLYTSAPKLLGKKDLTLFVGLDEFYLITTCLRNKNYFHFEWGQAPTDTFVREFLYPGHPIKVVGTKGLNGSNKRVLTSASNIVIGVDSLVNPDSFRVYYSVDEDAIKFRSKFRIGVNAAFYNEIIYSEK